MSEYENIQELADLVSTLRQLDTGFQVFGAKRKRDWGHDYMFNPCVDRRDIDVFEQKNGLVLPEDYREFLLCVGNGGAGPYYGIKTLQTASDEDSELGKPFPWSEETPSETCWEEGGSWVGSLVLSEQGCGYTSFLVVRGQQYGQVWDDFLSGDGPLVPTGLTFYAWYRNWAERCIKTIQRVPLLDQVELGMPLQTACRILGEDSEQWEGQSPDDIYMRFRHSNATFRIAQNGTIRSIQRMPIA
jgi:hypothetical protein